MCISIWGGRKKYLYQRVFKKLFIVLVWVVIVVGMYRCSAYLSDFEEDTADKAEESAPEENKEDTKPIKPNSKDPVHDALALDGQVRVLIMNQGYQSIYHTELVIACSEEMTIDQDGKISMVPSGSEYVLTPKKF